MNPRHAERRHAWRATLPNPILWARHGAACAGFLAGYAAARVRRTVARDVHAVGKSHPPRLPRVQLSVAAGTGAGAVRLPDYAIDERVSWPGGRPGTTSSTSDDLETYFAANRWGECLQAIGGTDAEVAAAVRQARDWRSRAPVQSDPAWE